MPNPSLSSAAFAWLICKGRKARGVGRRKKERAHARVARIVPKSPTCKRRAANPSMQGPCRTTSRARFMPNVPAMQGACRGANAMAVPNTTPARKAIRHGSHRPCSRRRASGPLPLLFFVNCPLTRVPPHDSLFLARLIGEHRARLRASRSLASPAFTPQTLCSPTRRRHEFQRQRWNEGVHQPWWPAANRRTLPLTVGASSVKRQGTPGLTARGSSLLAPCLGSLPVVSSSPPMKDTLVRGPWAVGLPPCSHRPHR